MSVLSKNELFYLVLSSFRKSFKLLISMFFSVLPIDGNKILIDNFHGRGYGENPKYIAEILRRDKQLKIIWLTNNANDVFPDGIVPVNRHSLRAYYESATAKVWVFNIRYGKLTRKRKGQIYLQTWHGPIALKKVEKDAEEKLPANYVAAAKEDGTLIDGILADSKPNEDLFVNSFWLSDRCEVLKYGSPRTDCLLKEQNNAVLRHLLRSKIGVDDSTFLVLYAPTFRENNSTSCFISSFEQIIKTFEQKYGNTRVAVRFHPNTVSNGGALQYGSSIIDLSSYPDADELVLAADCLITDYSSIAYDFALIHKPVFLFVIDLQSYTESPGVYPVFYDQPFRLNATEAALVNDICERKQEEYEVSLQHFYEKYPTYNSGHASEMAVDWLREKGLGN